MKKVVAIFLLLSLCLGLFACAGEEKEEPVSMEVYKKRLSANYEITQLTAPALQEFYGAALGLKATDYDVKSAFKALHTSDSDKGLVVMECGSPEKAEKLQEDLALNIATLREKYGQDCIISLNGVYILVGGKPEMTDATGNTYK